MRRDDVRRCLISLNLAPEKSEVRGILDTIDPLDTGFVDFKPFFEYAAIAIHSKDGDDEGGENEDDDEDGGYEHRGNEEEVRAAYALFTHGAPGPITLAHLKRIAKELRDDVPDDVLKDMIREANGTVKGKGAVGGVSLEEFEAVMRRAGVSMG